MRPGEVTSDKQAFVQILNRLEGDVGTIMKLILNAKILGAAFKDTAPFWALIRMMFPIAESVGDLIHRQDSTVRNLTLVLQNQFGTGYKDKANILAVLYRHSLTHQDEMRCLLTDKKEVIWIVTYGVKGSHLEVKLEGNNITVHFDTTAFYDDLVKVVQAAEKGTWSGEVMNRYNSWLTLDLDADAKKYKFAIKEIGDLFMSLK